MDVLKLYTAERGIIRNKDKGDIVAINRLILGESFNGLLIKRTSLNEYLKRRGKCLFYCLLGEKELISEPHYQILDRHNLTGAALYRVNDAVEMIQPLRFETKEDVDDDNTNEDDDMPLEEWLSIQNLGSTD